MQFLAPAPVAPVEVTSRPTFSILLAAYQAASTIGEAVASALAQTEPALEVIVCDDGSTDDLDSALEPYRDRVHLLRKPNGGAASARNHATRAASGDFVVILDSDDLFDPRRLEALANLAAARPDLDIVTTDAYVEKNGQLIGRFNRMNPFEVDDQRARILENCFVGGWPAIRRSRVLAVGGWDESFRIAYDWEISLRLILAGARAGLVDEPLMSYRLHDGSLSANRIDSLAERVRLLRKAQRHPSLTPRERQILQRSIRWQQLRFAHERAHVQGWASPFRRAFSPALWRYRLIARTAGARSRTPRPPNAPRG